MKYLKYYFFLLIISVNLSCNSSQRIKNNSPGFFQGEVTYSITFDSFSKSIQPDQLATIIGNKMIMTFKEGNYVKRYYDPDGNLKKEIYLNLDKGKSMLKSVENDTLYFVDITKNDSKTVFKLGRDSSILNYPTKRLITKTVVGGYGDDGPVLTGELFFAKDLKVDPGWYKNYLEGNFNEQIKIGGGIQLQYTSSGTYYRQTVSAISVAPRTVKSQEVELELKGDEILKEL